ncbi:protein of unknown function [Sediminibacterium ginsengisoli]|uniref:Protein kinase domain-containing protein n=2 Tax=Sediminibacterium ginsengisoli TaxID=413434 RepID=A0A1T4P882_9BACT|nr:protein of unknown function [Sediminibacterium ginsengisoli]
MPVLQEKRSDELEANTDLAQSDKAAQVNSGNDRPAASSGTRPITQRFKHSASPSSNSTDSQSQFKPSVKPPNQTGLPDQLKDGIEEQSGFAMDDVRVYFNSDKPAQLKAHAYAQGTDIHVAPGQEKHLPHEAWHVVQQKQGRVKPTIQMKEQVNINDDDGLEKEADVMGAKAMQLKRFAIEGWNFNKQHQESISQVVQGNQLSTGSTRSNTKVFQLTRLTSVTEDEYDTALGNLLELGGRIGKASAAGVVHKGTLNDETFERYQNDEEGDIPIDKNVAVKIVSSAIVMKGNVPLEVYARDEIEKKNKDASEEYRNSITPDTYEAITVTDPDNEDEVKKYVIIMRYEKLGAMSEEQVDRIGKYNAAFDAKMKKYAKEIKAALDIVKSAGYHPGDMKSDNILITNIDGDESPRAILSDFGSYRKAEYNTIAEDLAFVMNSIFSSKVDLPKKSKTEVATWMNDDKKWKPDPAPVAATSASSATTTTETAE